MLHRAFVYSGYPLPASELTVFFESLYSDSNGPGVNDTLLRLLRQAWNNPGLEPSYYNVCSEPTLREWSLAGGVATRGPDNDACLLEIGFGPSGAHYAEPQRTMLLVGPRWHARLMAAQAHVARAQATGDVPFAQGSAAHPATGVRA